jgi:hypothetical protein
MGFVFLAIAFGAGVVVGWSHTKISAWLVRRAEANKVVAAQKVVDAAKAAEKAIVDAKALLAAQLPPIPPNPKP